MYKGRPDDKTSQTVTDETNLTYAWNGTEREDVLFNLCGKTFSHLHYVSLCLVLIALGEQNHCIWVLEWYLIFEKSHVIMITLESVHHDK